MYRIQKNILLFILLLVSTTYAAAQKISFEAKAPKEVIAGENFRLTFTLKNASAKGENFKISSSIKDFDILRGPSSSLSTSTTFVKGKEVSTQSESYTYIVRAKKEGKFELPSASINVEGKTYKSNTVKIDVLPHKEEYSQEIDSDNAFIKTVVNEVELENGKAYEVIFRLYTTLSVKEVSNANFPDFPDFEILDSSTGRLAYEEQYNGQNYYVLNLKKYLLLPQKSGKTTFTEGNVEVVFNMQTGRVKSSFFGYVPETVEVRKTLSIEPFSIDAGLVGDWKSV